MPERVAVVDADNRFVRWTDRAEIPSRTKGVLRPVHAAKLPHRSVQVMLFDTAGRLVVQRRARTRLSSAGPDSGASGDMLRPRGFR